MTSNVIQKILELKVMIPSHDIPKFWELKVMRCKSFQKQAFRKLLYPKSLGTNNYCIQKLLVLKAFVTKNHHIQKLLELKVIGIESFCNQKPSDPIQSNPITFHLIIIQSPTCHKHPIPKIPKNLTCPLTTITQRIVPTINYRKMPQRDNRITREPGILIPRLVSRPPWYEPITQSSSSSSDATRDET